MTFVGRVLAILLCTITFGAICYSQTRGMLDIEFKSPTHFVLTDAEGRRTGTDPRIPQDYDEIPNTSYGDMGIGAIDSAADIDFSGLNFPDVITNPTFSENYSLQVYGTDNRIYTGQIIISQTATVGFDINIVGVIDQNQAVSYSITFSTNISQIPTVRKVVSSTSFQQDLENCHKLSLIPDAALYQNLVTAMGQYNTDISLQNYSSAWNDLLNFKAYLDTAHPYPSKITDDAYKILYEDATLLQDQIPKVSVTVQTRDVIPTKTQDLNFQVTVDGLTSVSPQTFSWVLGSTHQISTPTPQSSGPAGRFSFHHWSDGNPARTHNVTPSVASTFTAFFNRQYLDTVRANPQGPTFTVDSITYSSPYIVWWDSASTHTLSTTSPQSGPYINGKYTWTSWSDLMGISHTVTALSGGAYVSNFSYTVTDSVTTNWNMLSIPLLVADYRKTTLFPTAITPAYTYSSSYVRKDTLANGIGYWLKYSTNQVVSNTGVRLDSVRVPVKVGWNMLGTVSFDLPITKIRVTGIDTPRTYYGYNAASGYFLVDTLRAGFGYWVKPSVAETLILNIAAPVSMIPPGSQQSPPPAPGTPSAPLLSSPSNHTTGVSLSPTLAWNSSDGATGYYLQVSLDSGFTQIVYANSSVPSTSQQLTGLSYSTTYFWRVNAWNDFGSSWWSLVWSFTTQASPPPPPCNCCPQSVSQLDQFTLASADGRSQSIYVSNSGRVLPVAPSGLDMPPEPIENMFRAQFQSNKLIEVVPIGTVPTQIPFSVKNLTLPLKVTWNIKAENKTKYWITDPRTGQARAITSGSGSVLINDVGSGVIQLQAQSSKPCQ